MKVTRRFFWGCLVVALVGTIVCFYGALLDWSALQKADAQFRTLAAQGGDLRALFVAESRQNVHRINLFADVVWALLGCIWATVCVLGLELMRRAGEKQ